MAFRLSVDDVRLLVQLAGQWSAISRAAINEAQASVSEASTAAAAAVLPSSEASVAASHFGDDVDSSDLSGDSGDYTVVFRGAKLGLTLKQARGTQLAVVDSVKASEGSGAGGNGSESGGEVASAAAGAEQAIEACSVLAAGERLTASAGDCIVAVGGDSVLRTRFETIVAMIVSAPRPVVLTFRPMARFASPPASPARAAFAPSAAPAPSGANQPPGSPASRAAPEGSTAGGAGAGGLAGPGAVPSGEPGALPRACEIDTPILDRESLDGLVLGRGG